MRGIEFAEVRDAIARCFTADEFDMFLYERLDFDRPTEVADGPFKVVVTNVLKHFQQHGTDPFLIAEVAAARPLRSDVQEVYRKYAMALAGEAMRGQVAGETAKALERYGVAPRVDLQTGGVSGLRTLASAANEGFQRTIRPTLGTLHVAPWAKGLYEQSARVCRVEVGGIGRGTGFLVGPNAVLTNYHVLKEFIDPRADAPDISCLFDYRQNSVGQELEGTRVGVAKDWLINASPPVSNAQEVAWEPEPTVDQLDYALIRLDGNFGSEPVAPQGPERGWVLMPGTAPEIAEQMPIMILQHPNGEALKLAFDTNAVIRKSTSNTRIRYTTNTDKGSSGSPCFNLKWQLVALHQFGEPVVIEATYNQGIPIFAIRERLQREGKANALDK